MNVLAFSSDDLGAGFIAFVVVLVLAVATVLLLKSMNRHLRKVPSNFAPPADETASREQGGTKEP